MKTEISNFFVFVVIFLLGGFMVFCFLFRKQKPFFFENFKSEGKNNHQHKKECEKPPGVTLGAFFERPNPE